MIVDKHENQLWKNTSSCEGLSEKIIHEEMPGSSKSIMSVKTEVNMVIKNET